MIDTSSLWDFKDSRSSFSTVRMAHSPFQCRGPHMFTAYSINVNHYFNLEFSKFIKKLRRKGPLSFLGEELQISNILPHISKTNEGIFENLKVLSFLTFIYWNARIWMFRHLKVYQHDFSKYFSVISLMCSYHSE